MKMIFKALAKKLFGTNYERLAQSLFVCLAVFWGLHSSGWRVQVSPVVLYLMAGTSAAGVMWLALSSEDNAVNMLNMFMLPFDGRGFVFPYVAALGIYTFFARTAVILAALLAVSSWNAAEILGSVLCAGNAVLMAAAVYSLKKQRYLGGPWAAAGIAAILFWGNKPWFLPLFAVNGAFAALLLWNSDGYAFYLQEGTKGCVVKGQGHGSMGRYLFRYLKCHKNYLVNTVIMWCVACVLPVFFGKKEGLFLVPVGFAVLSLNTPVCILLSSDPALGQAVRFLPGQKKAFCIPYCLFIFLCNLAADIIFLCSWQLCNGGVTAWMAAAAMLFALQSAVFSVLLEWFYPIRGWKLESDLWHHPRKYIVPVAMLLLAGAVGTLPMMLPVLMALLAAEAAILLFACWRY